MQAQMARTEDLPAIDGSKNLPRTEPLLSPLRFEPIYQYRPWGGRRLADLLTEPLPSGPIGEAWLLSDRDDHASLVAEGPLKGQTIGQLLKQFPEQMLGKLAHRFQRIRCVKNVMGGPQRTFLLQSVRTIRRDTNQNDRVLLHK